MTEDALQFDKAEFQSPGDGAPGPAGRPQCTFCHKPLERYWAVGDKLACASCREQVLFYLEGGSVAEGFVRATLFGIGGGIAGAALWYLIGRVLNAELGLVAIAVGWLVGKAVLRGSDGRGGLQYQLLAVALTYVAITAAQVPLIAQALQFRHDHPGTNITREVLAGVQPSAEAYVAAVPIAVQMPFLGGIMSIIIAGIALYYAWQTNQKRVVPITGPHEVGTGVPPASPPAPGEAGGGGPPVPTA